MSPAIRSLVIPVSDLDAAKAVYTALLGSPHTDESYYVGYNINGFEVGLNPAGEGGGPVAFADVEDLDATRQTLLAAGATERDAPRQVAPQVRICVLADADGNPIGLRGKQPAWAGRPSRSGAAGTAVRLRTRAATSGRSDTAAKERMNLMSSKRRDELRAGTGDPAVADWLGRLQDASFSRAGPACARRTRRSDG